MIHLHDDGSYDINLDYFDFSNIDRQYTSAFERQLGIKPRSEDPVLENHQDLAASVQQVLELAVCNLVKNILSRYPQLWTLQSRKLILPVIVFRFLLI